MTCRTESTCTCRCQPHFTCFTCVNNSGTSQVDEALIQRSFQRRTAQFTWEVLCFCW
jgi:hypothetical protein